MSIVPAPSNGLGSNSNYFLFSNCNPMREFSITINITQDIVFESASGQYNGFAFQVNGYSPLNDTTAWQQYWINLLGTDLDGAINTYGTSLNQLTLDYSNLTSMASERIPAGYQLKIALQNDAQGNVIAATYVVTDNQGRTLANVTKNRTTDLAPIVAVEFNLVGPGAGESAVLSSGAGTIVYTASMMLTVLNQEPSCAEANYYTLETANSFYGGLPATSPNNSFSQSFEIKSAAVAPMIRKRGKPLPPRPIPRRPGG